MNNFTHAKIGVKLMSSYLFLCILLLVVGGGGWFQLNTMNKDIQALYYDSLIGITNIKNTAMILENTRLLTQRAVLPQYINEFSALEDGINKNAREAKEYLKVYSDAITDKEDQAMFQELLSLITVYEKNRDTVMNLVKRGDYETAMLQYQNQTVPATIACTDYINKIVVWNDNTGKSYIKNAEESYDSAITFMVSIIVIGLAAALLLGFFITRSIVSPINVLIGVSNEIAAGDLSHAIEIKRQDEIGQLETAINNMLKNLREIVRNMQSSADNLATSSEQLTAGADQSAQAANNVTVSIMEVSQGAERQLRLVSETVNTAEKMSAEAEQIASNANVVASTTDKTAHSASQGRKAVETAINQMAFIQKTVEDLAQEIIGLGTRSKEIGQIVETISGIAAQTNLLALNAAIEAARAGEQGRGFAVVADEVRKLAEQSQEAAKQIASLIGAIQVDTDKAVQSMEAGTREVKTGAELVNNAGAAFKEIAELVNQTTSQVREISESIHHMADDSQTIAAGAQEINTVTRNTSEQTQSVSAATEEQLASMQEISSASQALAKRAEELRTVAQKFVM